MEIEIYRQGHERIVYSDGDGYLLRYYADCLRGQSTECWSTLDGAKRAYLGRDVTWKQILSPGFARARGPLT
jgi:hypothetical protein